MIRYGRKATGIASAGSLIVKDENISLGSGTILNFLGDNITAIRNDAQQIDIISSSTSDSIIHENELYALDTRINKFLSVKRIQLYFFENNIQAGFINPFTKKYQTADGGFFLNHLAYITKIQYVGDSNIIKSFDIRNNKVNTIFNFSNLITGLYENNTPILIPTIPSSLNVYINHTPEELIKCSIQIEIALSF